MSPSARLFLTLVVVVLSYGTSPVLAVEARSPLGRPFDVAQENPEPGAKQLEQERAKAEAQKEKQLEQERAKAEAQKEKQLEQERAKADAEKQKQLEQERAKAEAQQQKQLEQEPAKADAEKQKQLQQERAKAEGEKQKQLEQEPAKAEAQKQQQLQHDKAKAEAEKQKQLEQEPAKADAEKQKQLQQERAKAEGEKQKQLEQEPAKADAEKQKQLQQERAKAEGEKQKQLEQERAKADAEKQKQLEQERAKAEGEKQKQLEQEPAKAEAQKQQQLQHDKAKAEAEKQKQLEQEPAKADAEKQKQLQQERAKAEGEKQKQLEAGHVGVEEKIVIEERRQERKEADKEFDKAKEEARKERQKENPEAARIEDPAHEARLEALEKNFENLRQQRRERLEEGGRRIVIEEPDNRRIIREEGRSFIHHDETERFQRLYGDARTERHGDVNVNVVLRSGGVQIFTDFDDDGRPLRRYRRDPDGREIVFFDNRDYYRRARRDSFLDAFIDLPPPVVDIPREHYIVDYDRASDDDIYFALTAPPVERLERTYSLEEIRYSHYLRDRMPRVDLDTINFDFASWEVEPDQYPKLERVAHVMNRIIDQHPAEMFLIEGHTDAVGSVEDNLSLSDRRAEAVAEILTREFNVPPENLTTQGYGKQFLKIQTPWPERVNRRVAVRRITPLLSRSGEFGSRY